MARLGANNLGVDASESNIAIARLHASADPKLSQLSYLHGTAGSLLHSPKRYDVVCSMEVLEHVDNPASFLFECAELLKPGGHLFLSTISRTPLAYFITIFLAEEVARKVSPGTHTYSKFIKPSELVAFFQKYTETSTTKVDPGASRDIQEGLPLQKPWISPHTSSDALWRSEAEVRGLIYNPFQAKWTLAARGAWNATNCNYLFCVRKPNLP